MVHANAVFSNGPVDGWPDYPSVYQETTSLMGVIELDAPSAVSLRCWYEAYGPACMLTDTANWQSNYEDAMDFAHIVLPSPDETTPNTTYKDADIAAIQVGVLQ